MKDMTEEEQMLAEDMALAQEQAKEMSEHFVLIRCDELRQHLIQTIRITSGLYIGQK